MNLLDQKWENKVIKIGKLVSMSISFAGEIFLSEKLGDKNAAEKLRTEYINERQFKYTPVIIPELEKFSKGEYKSYYEVVQNTMDKLMNQ